ncbi:hypothetical protein PPL_10956 [Heterostelium album PN500]|uniref:RUN domain-containing protein n=1 Tax=Heterostelium pallidum (strain ATCC 26659 / Pp 5 / PN500) TaxID=670386 RepID=D3BSI7_HETP5|nr:hypothetical protein PPL_10956 [Heterostelium album PN500]EFA75452.1 hypothetical protein PPL_10956 [Heterostelium album PN500]|eukprot:XP_020427586.1 hypothetical protein PPL_10956 [Heterostelium album PN500]
MIGKVNKIIKECLQNHFSTGKALNESCPFLNPLCFQIELFLTHKLKLKYGGFATIWDILQLLKGLRVDSLTTTTSGAPLVWREQFEYIDSLSEVTTDTGKARAFLRRCLNESILNAAIESITTNHDILRNHYDEDSILRFKDDSDVYRSILVPLETIPFQIDYNDSALDHQDIDDDHHHHVSNSNINSGINNLTASNDNINGTTSTSSPPVVVGNGVVTPLAKPALRKKKMVKSLTRVININGEGQSEVVESQMLKDTFDDKGVTTTTTIVDEKTGKTKIIKKIKVTKKVLKVNSNNNSSNNLNNINNNNNNNNNSNNNSNANLTSTSTATTTQTVIPVSTTTLIDPNVNDYINNESNSNYSSGESDNSGFRSSGEKEKEKTPEIVQMIKEISISDIKSKFSSFFSTSSPKSTLTNIPTTKTTTLTSSTESTPSISSSISTSSEQQTTNEPTTTTNNIDTALTSIPESTLTPTSTLEEVKEIEVVDINNNNEIKEDSPIIVESSNNDIENLEVVEQNQHQEQQEQQEEKEELVVQTNIVEQDGASIISVEDKAEEESKSLLKSVDSFGSLNDVLARLDVVSPALSSQVDVVTPTLSQLDNDIAEYMDVVDEKEKEKEEEEEEEHFRSDSSDCIEEEEHEQQQQQQEQEDEEEGIIVEEKEESIVNIKEEVLDTIIDEIEKEEEVVEEEEVEEKEEEVVEEIKENQPSITVSVEVENRSMTLEEEVAAYERHRAMLDKQLSSNSNSNNNSNNSSNNNSNNNSNSVSGRSSLSSSPSTKSNIVSEEEQSLILDQVAKIEEMIGGRSNIRKENGSNNNSFSVTVSSNNPHIISTPAPAVMSTPPQSPFAQKHHSFSPYFVPASTPDNHLHHHINNHNNKVSNTSYSDVDELTDDGVDNQLDFDQLDLENNSNNNSNNNNNEYLNNLSSDSSSPSHSRSNSITASFREDYIPEKKKLTPSALSASGGLSNTLPSEGAITKSSSNPFINYDAGVEEKPIDPKDFKWTPLRRRLYFEIHTQYTIREQNNQCAGCSRSISGLFTSSRYCEYSDFLKSCTATGPEDYKMIGNQNDHLANDVDFYSLADLVHYKRLYESLRIIVAKWLNHVETCPLCTSKGSFCEFCDAKEPIFPYNISKVVQCSSCHSSHHKECYVKHKCPKCLRIAKRKITVLP